MNIKITDEQWIFAKRVARARQAANGNRRESDFQSEMFGVLGELVAADVFREHRVPAEAAPLVSSRPETGPDLVTKIRPTGFDAKATPPGRRFCVIASKHLENLQIEQFLPVAFHSQIGALSATVYCPVSREEVLASWVKRPGVAWRGPYYSAPIRELKLLRDFDLCRYRWVDFSKFGLDVPGLPMPSNFVTYRRPTPKRRLCAPPPLSALIDFEAFGPPPMPRGAVKN